MNQNEVAERPYTEVKERPKGITLISLFWALTNFLAVTQAIQILVSVLPVLPHLSELWASYSEVFIVEDLTELERQWLYSGLPVEARA